MSDRPLHEYIDLEAYGVVTQESYDALKARAAKLEAALRAVYAEADLSDRLVDIVSYALSEDGA